MGSDIERFGGPEADVSPSWPGGVAPDSPSTALAPLMDMGPAEIERTIEQTRMAAEAMKRITTAAMARLFPKDFIDFGGRPYLKGSGAERLCDVGISLSEPIFEIETLGDDVFVECMVEAKWTRMLRSEWGLGTCNTRDKFWDNESPRAIYAQFLAQAGGNQALARRMLRGHIKKKAYENAVSRAVSAVMGIKGLRWEDLATMGFTPETAGGRVAFDGGKSKPAPAPQATAVDIRPTSIAELKREPIETRCALLGVIFLAGKKHGKRNQYTVAHEPEGSETVDVIVWGEAAPPAWVKSGVVVSFPEVTVGEYQGSRQYVATEIKEVMTQ